MSDLAEVLQLLREFRTEIREDRRELREDLREIKREVKRTNGRVTVLETRDESDREGKKRWQDFVPMVVNTVISVSISILLYTVIFHG